MSAKATRRQDQKEATRQIILDATIACLKRDGYQGTTIGAICDEAGVARGLINYHFDSKDALIAEAESEILRTFIGVVYDVALNTSPSQENAILLLENVWQMLHNTEGLLGGLFGLLAKGLTDEQFRIPFRQFVNEQRQRIDTALSLLLGPIAESSGIPMERATATILGSIIGMAILAHFQDKETNKQDFETFKLILDNALSVNNLEAVHRIQKQGVGG